MMKSQKDGLDVMKGGRKVMSEVQIFNTNNLNLNNYTEITTGVKK